MCPVQPLKLPSGAQPINYSDWSAKCPEEKETLAARPTVGHLKTHRWHFSSPASLDFIDTCLRNYTQRKSFLSILLIFLKKDESIWGDEIRKGSRPKPLHYSWSPFLSLLLLSYKHMIGTWRSFYCQVKINARQRNKCSLQGEKD